MRVPRMRILGLEFDAYNKIELLAGPFYYYCLALLVLAGFSCGASCIRRSACTCARCATTRKRPNTSACACASSGWPPS